MGHTVFTPSTAAYCFYADGTQSGATALAAQDTNYTADISGGNVVILVRFRVQENGAADGTGQYQLRYAKNGGAATDVVSGTVSNVRTYDSANLTNGGNTTQRLGFGSGSFIAGRVAELGLTASFTHTASNYTEVLFSIELQAADLADGDTLAFSLSHTAATISNDVFPVITIEAGPATQNLAPPLLTSAPSFPAATVTPGPVSVAPGLHSEAQSFPAPTVAPGAISLLPALLTSAAVLFAPTVTQNQTLEPSLLVSSPTLYAPTVVQITEPVLVATLQDNATATAGPSGGDITIDVSSLTILEDDILVLNATAEGTADGTFTVTGNNSGAATIVADLYADDNGDVNMVVALLVQGATADTSIVVDPAIGTAAGYYSYIIRQYRSVDTTTPQDVAATTAASANSDAANPSSITPTTAGTKIVLCYGAAQFGSAGTGNNAAWGAPGDVDNFVQQGYTLDEITSRAGMADKSWSSGAFDAAAVTSGAANSAASSWAAVALALRPAADAGQTLEPSLLTSAPSFPAPTVAAGPVTLTPSLLTDADTLYTPTVAPGAVSISPSLLTSAPSLHTPVVGLGEVTLAPPLLSLEQTFHAATVAAGAVSIAPPVLAAAPSLFTPTVDTASILTPGLLTEVQSFPAPTVTAGAVSLEPSLLTEVQTFHSATVDFSTIISPPLFSSPPSFHAPTVAAGAVTLEPPLLDSSAQIHEPTVTSSYDLLAPLLTEGETFYSPTVAIDQVLAPPLLYATTDPSAAGSGSGVIVTVTRL